MLREELRLAIRSLTTSWRFTLLALASLTIGLGANTALFSLVDALLLRSLPVPDPAGLVLIQRSAASGKAIPIDAATLDAIASQKSVYLDAAIVAVMPSAAVTVGDAPEPSRQVFAASPTFFTTLGLTARVGRLTLSTSAPAVILSDRYWRTRFGRDQSVIGRPVTINGQTHEISGVAPPGFLGVSLDSAADMWVLRPDFPGFATSALARLRPETSIEQAAAATVPLLNDPDVGAAAGQSPIHTSVTPGGQGTSNLRDRYRAPLVALMGLVALVLLVTCSNLANLLVVRNVNRMHELQVRAALGARRFRLVRQLLTEAFVLGILGAAAGWLCARQIVALLLSTLPATEAAARFEFHADPRVLVFMAASTFVTVLGFSVLPVWRASRVNVSTALKASGHGTQRVGRRLALLTVGVQMALSIVLLAGAAMFVQTVRNASTMSLGFDRRDLIEVELADRVLRLNASEVHQIHTALFEGLRAIPGVKVVALSYPFFPSWAFGIEKPEGEAGYRTSVDYFAAMRIPLLRGRLLTEADADREDPVVVVNDWYARGWFPGDDAIGKRGGFNNALIVGVVGNAATTNVRWDDPTVYRLARASEARLAPALVVRTAAGIERTTLFRPIEQVVRRVNPRLFVAVRTPDDALNRSIARERMVAATSSLFAFAGIVLAGVGLFGVAASAVAHRSVELGLRAALGASRWQIIREALRGTAIAITAGVAAGIAITAVVSRQLGHFISGLLIGLGPSDWMVLTSAAAAMLTVALVASVVPAIRAGRIDPLETMRRT